MVRSVGLMLVVLVGIILCQQNQRAEVFGQRNAQSESSAEVITHSVQVGDKLQVLTVIDPRMKTMCVYHVDLPTGSITLKSARGITYDLQLTEFNSGNPLPARLKRCLNNGNKLFVEHTIDPISQATNPQSPVIKCCGKNIAQQTGGR